MKKSFKDLMLVLAAKLNRATGGKLTPNALTITGLVLHLPLGILIINNHLLIAGLGLIFVSLLDALDGALARVQKSTSDFGAWLDASSDRLKEVIVFGSLTYALLQQDPISVWTVSLSTFVLGISLLISYVKAKGEALLANRSQAPIGNLNDILGGGLLSYEWRIIVLSLTLIFKLWTVGLLILAVSGAVTVVWRGLKFKQLMGKREVQQK